MMNCPFQKGERDLDDTNPEASSSNQLEGSWRDLAAFLLSDDDTAVSLGSSWLLTLLISLAEQYLHTSEPSLSLDPCSHFRKQIDPKRSIWFCLLDTAKTRQRKGSQGSSGKSYSTRLTCLCTTLIFIPPKMALHKSDIIRSSIL